MFNAKIDDIKHPNELWINNQGHGKNTFDKNPQEKKNFLMYLEEKTDLVTKGGAYLGGKMESTLNNFKSAPGVHYAEYGNLMVS